MTGRFVLRTTAEEVMRWLYYFYLNAISKPYFDRGVKHKDGKFTQLWMDKPESYKLDESGAITVPIDVVYGQNTVSSYTPGRTVEFDKGIIEVELVPLPDGVGVELRTDHEGGLVSAFYQDLWLRFAERWEEAEVEARRLFGDARNKGGHPVEDNEERDAHIFNLNTIDGLSYRQIAERMDISLGYESVKKIVQRLKRERQEAQIGEP